VAAAGVTRSGAGSVPAPSRGTIPEASSASITSSGTESTLRISDAAARAGVSARTLRYYEELGLISPSGYTTGGARRYGPADLARIERIQELKEVLGLNLDDIKGVLDAEARIEELRRDYRASVTVPTPRARRRRRAILEEGIERREALTGLLDRKLARLDAFRGKLTRETARSRELLAELDADAPTD